jgi:Hypothetical methyltransferase/SNF2-related domain
MEWMDQNTDFSSNSNSKWVQTKLALYDFIQEHGTSGIMPTSTELRQRGRGDLDYAIRLLGGYDHVAKPWGLTLKYIRKPGNYWRDFIHVAKELQAFIEEFGTPGIMPIKVELLRAGRGDLAKALTKHGGIEVVAGRLGLQLPSHKRKQRGYWEDFANVTSELQNFIAECGMLGAMPTQDNLTRAGLTGLANAINHHGGMYAVAERLGLRLSHTRHPDGYWDDFVNVERELLAFVGGHGTPGMMPSRNDLRQAGLHDLNGALEKHGGTSAVAGRLNLKLKIKPMGHWDDFANVERTLFAYIAEHGTPGMMPSLSELQRAKQSGLVNAITKKYGGIYAVTERLGLQLPSAAKPPSYWDNIEHIKLSIYKFNEMRGVPDVMPTGGELKKAGRTDLASAITNHGGFPALAERFGFYYTYTAKPDRYWKDFANIEQEILDFNQAEGISGRMPTTIELRNASKHSLTAAINAHGGFSSVGERLRLTTTTKPNGYWDDFANVERELLVFIQEQGTSGVMPTSTDLKNAGRLDLGFAIHRHSSFAKIAALLGLRLSYEKQPDGYWDDFANVERELLAFIQEQGTLGVMPTRTQLRDVRKHDLDTALDKHGGLLAVAERLSLDLSYTRKRPGYWNDFAHVRQALLDFVEAHGTPNMMPTRSEFQEAGRGDLISALDAHGGVLVVAERMGFVYTVKPDGYWDDFAHMKDALLQFIEEHGTSGVMPTTRELREGGQVALNGAIDRHGGLFAVARRLGLRYANKENITSHTAVIVEQLARSLQPLAESNLLSGAQVMIIQRRAGMLDYHNPRITRLNASLVHGNHDAIELALTQLRNAPEDEAIDLLEDEGLLQEDLTETGLEAVVGSDLSIEEEGPFPPVNSTSALPDLHQEQAAIRGLSALGAIRLPLDEVLGLLTSKILWEAFYKRLYTWYGSLHSTQTVTTADVDAAILNAYAGQMNNEFVIQAARKFTQEVEQAINFAMRLTYYGWTGPHLRLHQADAACRMADILGQKEHAPFLLNADDPGMGKSASFLAAVAVSGIRRILLLAPKTVADDTWADPHGEIRSCLAHASIVRGLQATLHITPLSSSATNLTFFVLHYEELLNDEMVNQLAGEQFDCLCIDEMHFVKQRGGQKETSRRETLEKLRVLAHSAIGLTGTPLVNELAEPLSLLQVLSHQNRQFDYTRLNSRRMGDIADVFEAILPHIVRRRKKDVLLHLPFYDVRPIEILLRDDLLERIRAIGMLPKAQANNALAELRKIVLQAKLPSIRTRAESAQKLLVLTYLRDEVSEEIYTDLQDFFPGQVGQINGTVPKERRKEILDAFRAPDGLRILVGTIGTIGVGLTLFDPTQEETAHEIIVADLPYTAAEFDQGIARLHREGQKHRVVVDVLLTITTTHLQDGSPLLTIDQRIWGLIQGKRELSDIAIDGLYATTDAATKVRKALHYWLKQIREIGIEPLVAEQRSAELSGAQKWRGEIARLRGMRTTKADELFANPEYTKAFLDHLRTSSASQLAYRWLCAKLEYLLRPDLRIVDMGCGLNPFAELPCHVTGLDRHELPGQVKGKMENPSLPDNSADVMIYSLSLYGTGDDLRDYFTHARRILRGGGHLFIVEPGSTFTPEGLMLFVNDLQQFGFEQVGKVRDIRGEDGIVLTGMHFTLTGEMGKPEETFFEKK